MKRDFLTLASIPAEVWPTVLQAGQQLRALRGQPNAPQPLAGKSVALVFEKSSTRTRVSFEVGVYELGGHAVVLQAQGSQLARGEPIEDTARVLSGYCQAIMLRTFGQERVETLAKWATVPVINGLSDTHHPCQLAADLLTVLDRFGRLDGLRYAWVGDGNNMANSWIEAAGIFGLTLTLACPPGYQPDLAMVAAANARCQALGKGGVTLLTDPTRAVRGANVISTDVWASMGQEAEAQARMQAFAGFCVDDALLRHAAPTGELIVLHCLPAHRGEEISASVLDGEHSAAWLQAEMRLHAQKAILMWQFFSL